MSTANQALLFDGMPLKEECIVPDGKVELSHKGETELQICVTDLIEETHVLRTSTDSLIDSVLAQVPLPDGMKQPFHQLINPSLIWYAQDDAHYHNFIL